MNLRIAGKTIGYGRKPFIIAEAGVNHNGRLDIALELIDAAKDAGADAVKFQTFKAEDVAIPGADMVGYQRRNIGKQLNQLEMLKSLELKDKFYKPLIRHCRKKRIIFLSTPHGGFRSVDLLESLNVPAYKIGSGDINNFPLLQYISRLKKPIILSTGMSKMKEVKDAVRCIKKSENKEIIVLHCTTNYPCPLEEVNLNAMLSMMRELDVMVGYSDHTQGVMVSVIAACMGAVMVEKHFTLDKALKGPDHKASLEPGEFKEMVQSIKNLSSIMGNPVKKPNKSELKMIKNIRKSVVSLAQIKKGEFFTADNIGIKRPGTGLEPIYYWKIIGKKAKRGIAKDCLLKKRDYA